MQLQESFSVAQTRQAVTCALAFMLNLGMGAVHAEIIVGGDVTPDPTSGAVANLFVGGSTTTVGTGGILVDGNGVKTTLTSQGTFFGYSTGSSGAGIVSAGGAWTDTSFFTIARVGGSTGGIQVTGANAFAGGAGNATNVGFGGNGSLAVTNGGAFEALFINVSRQNGSSGSLVVDGGASNVLVGGSGAFLTVGRENGSQGIASVSNGARIDIQNAINADGTGFQIGRQTGSGGTVQITSGASIAVTAQNARGHIGRGGVGALNLSGGGSATVSGSVDAVVNIGASDPVTGAYTGNGTVDVDGVGSLLSVQSSAGAAVVNIGRASGSVGELQVRDGGRVEAQQINVNANGLLAGGSGTVVALVALAGGTISPGNSIGTLAIDGDLAVASGTLLTQIAAVGAGGSDLLEVGGAATFTSGTFAFSFLGGFQPTSGSQWTFLSAADGVSGWEALDLDVSGLDAGYSYALASDGNHLTFSVAAVPEPETYVMVLVGLGLVGCQLRRKSLRAARLHFS